MLGEWPDDDKLFGFCLAQKMIDICGLVGISSRMHSRIIIPVRLNSKRLPGKALLPIAGKPLVRHVWERAREAGLGDEPIIATDSQEVAEAAREFGAQVTLTAAEHRCGSERVAEVAESLSEDLIINLQGDEVLIDPRLIARLPGMFEDPEVQMATAVARLGEAAVLEDTSLVKAVLDHRNNVLYFSRRPIPFGLDGGRPMPQFYGHLGVYAYRRETLLQIYQQPQSSLELAEGLEQLRALQAGHRIRAVVWEAEHFGINTPQDLEQVTRALGE
jgi:3-deoxy-manno-octulosonate cytidylyltransferase (CMP-KDO synthetase)